MRPLAAGLYPSTQKQLAKADSDACTFAAGAAELLDTKWQQANAISSALTDLPGTGADNAIWLSVAESRAPLRCSGAS